MDVLNYLSNSELQFGDFLVPWGTIIGTMGFLLAWFTVMILERLTWTRYIWHLPLFFVALAVLFGCVLGLLFTP